jgi:RNA methyltransferase, TrmH family
MITSADNPKVRQARALLSRRGREREAQCLVEGIRLIEDAMRAGMRPAFVFFGSEARQTPRAQTLLPVVEAAGVPLWELSQAAFDTLSDTVTSQGVLAVVPIPALSMVSEPTLILVLDQLRDPGNLGTILRSAEAAGVELVLLAQGCTDPWSPKVLRAGMGAHFRLPIRTRLSWTVIQGMIAGCSLWVANASGSVAYDEVDWTQPSALVVGGETTGISAEAAAAGRGQVTIPMRGGTDSLNAAMATTVVLFEAARQRRARTER